MSIPSSIDALEKKKFIESTSTPGATCIRVVGPDGGDLSIGELPTAALLADNMAVPTTTLIGAVICGYDGTNIDLGRLDSSHSLQVNQGASVYTSDSYTAYQATAVPESVVDATGQDAYTTVLTPSTTFRHIQIINEGANAAIVSINAGATDTFKRIPTGVFSFDGVAITTAAIQAKNYTAGSNYTNLTIIVW